MQKIYGICIPLVNSHMQWQQERILSNSTHATQAEESFDSLYEKDSLIKFYILFLLANIAPSSNARSP